MAETIQDSPQQVLQGRKPDPTLAFLSHLYDEVPEHDPETAPEEQVSTGVLTDSIHLDLETRFVLAGLVTAVAIPIFLVGMAVWVAVVNNWNFLSWME